MPYGRGFLELKLPKRNLREIRVSEPPNVSDEEQAIVSALRKPSATEPLLSMIGQHERVAVIIDDVTRPTPSGRLISSILDEVKTPKENMIIIVATGLHRANRSDELSAMLGPKILEKSRVANHDAYRKSELVHVGRTRAGTSVEVNKLVATADKIIATGHIEPHEYAGFTGGRKSILPGVAGIDSINQNHRLENLDHPKAKIGVLDGNPIHEDMLEAARMVGVDFCLNVVQDSEKRIAKVVAGDLTEAHRQGVEFCRAYGEVDIGEPADIVVTSTGYPLDIDFYQSIKAVMAAEPFVRKGGTMILLAECQDGFGGRLFHDYMKSSSSPGDIMNRIAEEGYTADIDHCYLLARLLKDIRVIAVSSKHIVHEMNKSLINTTASSERAVRMALEEQGRDANITVLPYAQRVIPKVQ